jgi:AraC-like DNA-binding protein
MNKSVRSDLNHFIRYVIMALKPIAKAEDIKLSFTPSAQPVVALFLADNLAHDIARIVCKMVEFTSEQEEINVAIERQSHQKCKVILRNTGINISRNGEVTYHCKLPIAVISSLANATQYEIEIDLHEELAVLSVIDEEHINGPNFSPDYYVEVRKRLRSHFTKSENLLETLFRQNPREASFLKKVNDLVLANIENSQLDTNYLSEKMNMSRTQLFRRLKPIIRQSPGSYIRTIKLQRAKDLFETTDLRISEVAYKTGFETASHFTKAFTKQYGVKPSLFCRRRNDVTNGQQNATSATAS